MDVRVYGVPGLKSPRPVHCSLLIAIGVVATSGGGRHCRCAEVGVQRELDGWDGFIAVGDLA